MLADDLGLDEDINALDGAPDRAGDELRRASFAQRCHGGLVPASFSSWNLRHQKLRHVVSVSSCVALPGASGRSSTTTPLPAARRWLCGRAPAGRGRSCRARTRRKSRRRVGDETDAAGRRIAAEVMALGAQHVRRLTKQRHGDVRGTRRRPPRPVDILPARCRLFAGVVECAENPLSEIRHVHAPVLSLRSRA